LEISLLHEHNNQHLYKHQLYATHIHSVTKIDISQGKGIVMSSKWLTFTMVSNECQKSGTQVQSVLNSTHINIILCSYITFN